MDILTACMNTEERDKNICATILRVSYFVFWSFNAKTVMLEFNKGGKKLFLFSYLNYKEQKKKYIYI